MKKLILILIIVLGALCPLYSASIDDWNGVDWATKADDFNGVDVATKVSSMNGVAGAAAPTNYLTNADLCGAWLFENDLTDSSGSGSSGNGTNDLTGTTTYSTETGVHQGTYSKINTGLQAGTRSDGDLSSGFPGKSSGGTNNKISITTWFNYHTMGYGPNLIAKQDAAGNNLSFRLWLNNSTGKINFDIYTSGTTKVTYAGNTTIEADTDYFVAATWDGSNVNLYLGDASNSPTTDMTQTARTTAMSTAAEASTLYVGANYLGLSYIDELSVFKDGLSASEVAEIWEHGLDGSR